MESSISNYFFIMIFQIYLWYEKLGAEDIKEKKRIKLYKLFNYIKEIKMLFIY